MSLVTADGSVDCMKDPGEQEKLVEYLHYGETVTALKILRTGNVIPRYTYTGMLLRILKFVRLVDVGQTSPDWDHCSV